MKMSELTEFHEIIETYKECSGVKPGGGGCACMGGCLGNHLAMLRQKYDQNYKGNTAWWSDQGHCKLKVRPGDSGHNCAALNAKNYWTGVK